MAGAAGVAEVRDVAWLAFPRSAGGPRGGRAAAEGHEVRELLDVGARVRVVEEVRERRGRAGRRRREERGVGRAGRGVRVEQHREVRRTPRQGAHERRGRGGARVGRGRGGGGDDRHAWAPCGRVAVGEGERVGVGEVRLRVEMGVRMGLRRCVHLRLRRRAGGAGVRAVCAGGGGEGEGGGHGRVEDRIADGVEGGHVGLQRCVRISSIAGATHGRASGSGRCSAHARPGWATGDGICTRARAGDDGSRGGRRGGGGRTGRQISPPRRFSGLKGGSEGSSVRDRVARAVWGREGGQWEGRSEAGGEEQGASGVEDGKGR